MPVAARSPLRCLPVGPGDDLEQVAAGVVEVDAAAAVEAVDLAAALAPVVGVEGGARFLEPRERRVELGLAHQEGAVVRPEIVVLAEVERDAVLRPHRHEMPPLPLHLHAEDGREELGRGARVLGGNDDVVELDGHGLALLEHRLPRNIGLALRAAARRRISPQRHGGTRHSMKRRNPSLSTSELKFINNPTLCPLSLRYVSILSLVNRHEPLDSLDFDDELLLDDDVHSVAAIKSDFLVDNWQR